MSEMELIMDEYDAKQRINTLLHIALSMAQELQEFIDDAVESSGDLDACLSTQMLVKEWEDVLNGRLH